MLSKTRIQISSIALALSLSPAVLANELISNGSFERFTISKDNGKWKLVQFDSWQGSGEIWTNDLGKAATDGNYKIELDIGRELDRLSQTVTTIADQKYRISLDAYARRSKSSDFEILIDDKVIATIQPDRKWAKYAVYFIGKGGDQVLSIRELEHQNDHYGTVIDNVSLQQSNELITNGSFEDFQVNKDHGNWKEVNFTAWEGAGEVWNNRLGKRSTMGAYKIELDVGRELNTLSQTVATEENLEYELSLDAYARREKSADFEIWVGEDKLATITPNRTHWERYSVKFYGKGLAHTISFKEVDSQSNGFGTIIDNVSLLPTGETQTKNNTPVVLENVLEQFGIASQGGTYKQEYASRAIDGDTNTYNHTTCNATGNWWQVALPSPTLISKISIRSRTDRTDRIEGATVYISDTAYNGTLNENDKVTTLQRVTGDQITTFEQARSGSYLIVKAAGSQCLHMEEVQVYGEMPAEPNFASHETDYLIQGSIPVGQIVATLNASDYQGDQLSYQIIGDVPFSVDAQGNIQVKEKVQAGTYSVVVAVSDGANTTQTTLSIQVTSKTAVADAIASGDVTNVTEQELIQATLDEIEASKSALLSAKTKIFNLNADGSEKDDGSSLTAIDWNPSHDASLFTSTLGKNTPLLITNAVAQADKTIYNKEIAIIGEKGAGRYLVMGANPLRVTGNAQMDQVMENSISWLTGRDDLKNAPFNVVISHLDESYWFKDESKTRTWLDQHYAGQVQYNIANACDASALAACLSDETDLLIISQLSQSEDDLEAISTRVDQALQQGIPVLYIHHDGNQKALGKALFSKVFDVTYQWDNYWKKLSLSSYDPTSNIGQLSEDISKIKTLFQHFKNQDYSFDWSQCNGEDCKNVAGLNTEFTQGATIVRDMMRAFDANRKNIFNENGYPLQKLLALTGDKFRQNVRFPMDKVTTDDTQFMKSYYADYAVYNSRLINPAQVDMGNFSRSNFDHITPSSKTVNLTSKNGFRSTGAYALPGQTVYITRNDQSDVTVKVFINTLRSGSTHQWATNGYSRPKFLQSQHIEIKSGETISLTSPYGGPLQLSFNKKDLPVSFTFQNIGEHAYWSSPVDNASFAQKLVDNEFDWAEIATAGFEVHSKLDKMIESVASEQWGGTAEGLANAVVKYTSNYPHVLAGFKGEGVDAVAEIHTWAEERGLTIETIDKIKHMNADQASCGYGCSGNPYDAYWAFNPIGHGDIHEMGHSLQKKRFEGFPNHAATNTFSYYTKSRYFDITGGDPSCQGLAFKSLFDKVQSAVGQTDVAAYLKTNLWDTAGLGEQYLLKIQAMMHAQKMGRLENGWHVLARVHILEREMSRAKQDWENRKESVGFSSYTLDEIKSIRDNDWLVVAYSYAAGLDYRNYFDMMGIPFSQQARDQIASFGFDIVPNSLFVSSKTGYCQQDEYGRLFDRPTLAIDGKTAYPY